ncbi:MAG TPA: DUF2199 domain-containing protein [Steroidobacteraceae bacterium]|jgi:hypothetical protein
MRHTAFTDPTSFLTDQDKCDRHDMMSLGPTAVIKKIGESERAARCDISPDMCALDRNRFFLLGRLPIPVRDRALPYRIGLWAELDVHTLGRVFQLWDGPSQGSEPPLSAILVNNVPLVPTTLGLAIDIRLTGSKTHPEFFLRDLKHDLASEQRDGVDLHRALQYSHRANLPPAS